MNRFVTFTAVAVAAAMLVPSGLAGWGSYGSGEPSSRFDTSAYMWQGGPGGTSDRVYFNVYNVEGDGGGAAINSAMLGGRLATAGPGTWFAVFGVWADCNHDGYVGMADGALLEYRAEVANLDGAHKVDTTLCPVVADAPENAGTIHNDGSWVTELIPIARVKASDLKNATNYRILADPTVKIWGDHGAVPETPAAAVVPNDHCHQATAAPVFGAGQSRHTGGMLQQVVCDESLFAPTPHDLYQTGVDDDPTGTVHTLPDPRSLYQDGGLLDVPTFGTDQACKDGRAQPCGNGNSNSVVYNEFDCSKPVTTVDSPAKGTPVEGSSADPGRNNGEKINVTYPVGSPQVNPSGTAPATLNETSEETAATDDCDSSNDSGHDFYGYPLESTSGNVAATGKAKADFNFALQGPQGRGNCNARAPGEVVFGTDPGQDPIPGDPKVVPGATCAQPDDLGVAALSLLFSNDQWWAGTTIIDTHPAVGAPTFNKETLQVQPDTFPGDWYAFYASTSLATVSTPGGTGTYGDAYCTQGIARHAVDVYGWLCDPALWNIDGATGEKAGGWQLLGNVGDAYTLRDVDCYDMTAVGAGASPTGDDVGLRSIPAISAPDSGCD